MIRRSIKSQQGFISILCTLIVVTISIIYLFPIIWMLSTSLKVDGQVMIMPPKWIPQPIQWKNYPDALYYMKPVVFGNTIFITMFSVVAHLISCTLVAFGFARIRIKGSTLLFVLVLSGFMLPYQVALIPQFIMFTRWHMIDTFYPLILPTLGGAPFLIFLARQFFLTIPAEMDESARIDGCGYFKIYSSIIMPMSKPLLGIIAIQTFMNQWNDFMRPLIFLNSANKLTVSITLQNFRADYGMTPWNLLMAASLTCLLPCIILFFTAQKYFIQGIVITGVKG